MLQLSIHHEKLPVRKIVWSENNLNSRYVGIPEKVTKYVFLGSLGEVRGFISGVDKAYDEVLKLAHTARVVAGMLYKVGNLKTSSFYLG